MESDNRFNYRFCFTLFLTAFFLLIMLPLSSNALFGGIIENFSADQVEISPDGKPSIQ